MPVAFRLRSQETLLEIGDDDEDVLEIARHDSMPSEARNAAAGGTAEGREASSEKGVTAREVVHTRTSETDTAGNALSHMTAIALVHEPNHAIKRSKSCSR